MKMVGKVYSTFKEQWLNIFILCLLIVSMVPMITNGSQETSIQYEDDAQLNTNNFSNDLTKNQNLNTPVNTPVNTREVPLNTPQMIPSQLSPDVGSVLDLPSNGLSPVEQLGERWDTIWQGQVGANGYDGERNGDVIDINQNGIPEILTVISATGTDQLRGAAGFTKIYEFDSRTSGFTNEIYSEATATKTVYREYDAFGNGTMYYFKCIMNDYSGSDYHYISKYNAQSNTFVDVSNSITTESELNNFNIYDFDLDGSNEIYFSNAYYDGSAFGRLKFSTDGVLTKSTIPSGLNNAELIIEDLDNDDQMEIALIAIDAGIFIYDYNSGSDAFTQTFTVDLGYHHTSLWPWDYDNDGIMNLFAHVEPTNGADMQVVNYEWNGATYVADSLSLTVTDSKYYFRTGIKPVDLYGNGTLVDMLFSKTSSGVYQWGYVIYDGQNLIHKTIFQTSDSNGGISAVPIQIDIDPEYELFIYNVRSSDSQTENFVLDLTGSDLHLSYYEEFNDDVFSSADWTRTDVTNVVYDGHMHIPVSGGNDDYVRYSLPDNTRIIETRIKQIIPLNTYTLPKIRLYDDSLNVLAYATFLYEEPYGWIRYDGAYINGKNLKGPKEANTWYDVRWVIDNAYSSITTWVKLANSSYWEFLDTISINAKPTIFHFEQNLNYESHMDFLKVYTEGTEVGPSNRDAYSVYVEDQDKIYIFGGSSNGGSAGAKYNDIWVFDVPTANWTHVETATAPAGRYAHSIAYDAESRRIIIHGGYSTTYLSDTWAFSVDYYNWTQMSSGPIARSWSSMDYDAKNDIIVLFGGSNGGQLADTWSYDFNSDTWTGMNPSTNPSARSQHRITFDNSTGKFLMFGSISGSADTWSYEYATNTWTNLNPSNHPIALNQAETWYDPVRKSILLYGGYDGSNLYNDTWEFNSKINNWLLLDLDYETDKIQSSPSISFVDSIDRAIFFYALEVSIYSFDYDQKTWYGNFTNLGGENDSYTYYWNDYYDTDKLEAGVFEKSDTGGDNLMYIDTDQGLAIMPTDGDIDINEGFKIHIDISKVDFPLIWESRVNLVSGGSSYRTPWLEFYYSNGTKYMFAFNSANWVQGLDPNIVSTGSSAKSPSSENVWSDIQFVFHKNGTLIINAKYPYETDYTLISTTYTNTGFDISYLTYEKPFDSVNYIDYSLLYSIKGPELTLLSSFSVPSTWPRGLAFDGSNLWMVDNGAGNIKEIDPYSGSQISSFSAPYSSPFGLAWNKGTLIHTSGNPGGGFPSRYYELSTSGSTVDMFDINALVGSVTGVAFDGTNHIWAASWTDHTIDKINLDTQTSVESFALPTIYPQGLAFDGKYLWLAESEFGSVMVLDPSDGSLVYQFDVPTTIPTGIEISGDKLWVADYVTSKIHYMKIPTSYVNLDPLQTDLWAYYDFNEESGSVLNDKSENQIDGTIMGNPTYEEGIEGFGLKFDGIDDYVDLNRNFITTEDLSISFFTKPEQKQGSVFTQYTSLSLHDSFNFAPTADTDNKWWMRWHDGSNSYTDSSEDVNYGQWVHIALIKSKTNNNVSFYINNNLINSWTWDGTLYVSHLLNAYIAAANNNGSPYGFYQGIIDEVRLYNKTLTPSQIEDLYRQYMDPLDTDLWAYYDFNEGSGSVLTDISGNNPDGSHIGNPAYVTGIDGTALKFDGIDDWINTNANFLKTGSQTISAWFKPEVDAYGYILYQRSNSNNAMAFTMINDVGNQYRMYYYDSVGTIRQSPYVGTSPQWYHMVIVKDSETGYGYFYMNGELLSQEPYDGGYYTVNGIVESMWIGGSAAGAKLDGTIDEIRIYNKSLSATQVSDLYNLHALPADTIYPEISSPADFSINEGQTGQTVAWTVGDTNPSKYNLTQNGVYAATNSDWVNGTISYSLDGLPAGIYTYNLSISDAKGNISFDVVVVTVKSLDDLLWAYYNFNEGSGIILNDITGNTPGGTIGGDPTYVSGIEGSALYFDGIGDIIDLNQNFVKTGHQTISVWFKPEVGQTGSIIRQQSTSNNHIAFGHNFNGGKYIGYYHDDGGDYFESGFTDILDNTWYQVVLVKDAITNQGIFYVNGQVFSIQSFDGGVFQNIFVSATIGLDFEGIIDEVRFYNTSLSVVQVSELYNLHAPTPDTTKPDVTSPADFSITEGQTGQTVAWTVGDANPSKYNLTQNGAYAATNSAWVNGTISYSLDGLPAGMYTYNLSISDTAGNISYDVVVVTINEPLPQGMIVDDFNDPTYGYDPTIWNTADYGTANKDISSGETVVFSAGGHSFSGVITKPEYSNMTTVSVIAKFNTNVASCRGNGFGFTDMAPLTNNWGYYYWNSWYNYSTTYGAANTISCFQGTSNDLSFGYIKDGYASYSSPYTTDANFHNYTIVRGEAEILRYVDGVLVETYTQPNRIPTIDLPFVITSTEWCGGAGTWIEIDKVVMKSSSLSTSSDLWAHWNFNEGSGLTSTEQQGTGYDATLQNGAFFDTGVEGSGVYLDGVDDTIDLGYHFQRFDDMAVSIWFKPLSHGGNVFNIITRPTGTTIFRLDVASDGYYDSWFSTSSGNVFITSDTIPVELNVWAHAVIINDKTNGKLQFYLNGNLANEIAWDGTYYAVTTQYHARIGDAEYTPTGNFHGYVDETKFYNTSLSGTQVTDLYNLYAPVADITSPEISSPADFSVNYGDIGDTVDWSVGDENPYRYNITQNSVLIVTNQSWNNGTISYSLDDLAIGTFTYNLSISDVAGNIVFDVVVITVIDATAPTLNSPNDLQYIVGSTGNEITWSASDIQPDYYDVTINGSAYISGQSWTSGSIVVDIDGFAVASYTFVITVYDSSGLYAQDTVFLTVTTPATTPPSEPLNVLITSNPSQLTISWSVPSSDGGIGIDGYKVYRSTTSGSGYTLLITTTQLIYADLSVSNGVEYFYVIIAYNAQGDSPSSVEVSAIPAGIPGSPTNVQATAGDTEVTLTWSAPVDTGGLPITTYAIYRGTSSGSYIFLTNVTILTYLDTSVANDITYYYVITAFNAQHESLISNEVSATPVLPGTVPDAPTNLQVTLDGTSIIIDWQAPVDNGGQPITEYYVYRGTTSGSLSFLGSSTTLQFIDTISLAEETTYYYQVSAINAKGESVRASEVSIFYDLAPTIITGLTILGSDQSIEIQWNSEASANNYLIYRSLDGSNFVFLATTSSLSYIDSGLTNGQTYYYYVTGENAIGEGDPSNTVSAYPYTTPSTPVLDGSVASESITLTWVISDDGGSSITAISIYYLVEGDGSYTLLDTIIENSYTHNGLINGVSYSYKIVATNEAGNSNESNVKILIPLGPPSVPLEFNAQVNDDEVTLSWAAPNTDGGSPVTEYRIYRSTTSGSGFVFLVSTTLTEFLDQGLSYETTYYYKVAAVNALGEGPQASEIEVYIAINLDLPPAPTNLNATSGDGFVYLEWLGDAEVYNIYRADETNSRLFLGNTTNLYYTDSTVLNGILYQYFVTAVNNAGESSISNIVVAQPQEEVPPPSAIIEIDGVSMPGYNYIYWNYSVSGVEFVIHRAESGGNFISIGLTSAKFFADYDVIAGNSYQYYVIVINSGGSSDSSSEVVLEALPGSGYPSTVTNFDAAVSDSEVILTWNPPLQNAQGLIYHIYRSTNPNTLSLIGNTTTTEFIDNTVVNYIIYYYAIVAENDIGESSFSEVINVMSQPAIAPSTPDGFTIEATTNGVFLKWNEPENLNAEIVGYTILRSVGSNEFTELTVTYALNFTDYAVSDGVSYSYKLLAFNEFGSSEEVGPLNILFESPGTVPHAPVLTGDSNGNVISLTWTEPSYVGSGIVKYIIYQSVDNQNFIVLADTTTTSYTDTIENPGMTYYYRVSAVNDQGESALSNSVAVSTQMGTDLTNQLTSLSAMQNGEIIVVTWEVDSSTGIQKILLYRDDGNGYALIAILDRDTTTYYDGNVIYGSSYTYRLAANQEVHSESLQSNTVNFVNPNAETTIEESEGSFLPISIEVVILSFALFGLIMRTNFLRRREEL
ncbi:MAG: fibronectin type III domain-containing protein [Candidatus Heimdallarchaeota archaeon]|nr:fibronectin type III domain-containing protein [Candidatus Heimdallarchaeota archaeon]